MAWKPFSAAKNNGDLPISLKSIYELFSRIGLTILKWHFFYSNRQWMCITLISMKNITKM